MDHSKFLDLAAQEALKGSISEQTRAGAILVKNQQVVAASYNRCQELNDPIATAEMDCIRKAGRRIDQAELTLYLTRYPGMLIAGTVLQFSIGQIVIGLKDKSNKAIVLLKSKNLPVVFWPNLQCEQLLQESENV